MPTACPQCGRAAPRKSKLHSSDGLFRRLFFTAFRCRGCHFRFWQLNLFKPVLMIAIIGGALFLGWWIPKEERHIADAMPTLSHDQVAARAAQGDADAALMMGQRYADGNGVIKNDKEAVRWFEQAARAGKAEAQYRYGLALLEGRGVVQDYKAAFEWIERPAKLGHSNAQYTLGELYRYGTGTIMSKAQAYLWFNLAAAQGVEKAAKARDSLVWQLKPEQITAMQQAARAMSAGGATEGAAPTPPASAPAAPVSAPAAAPIPAPAQ